jgi:hypothetical protein
VSGILEDDLGRLWVSTHRGLCRFDAESRTFEIFDLTNGLQSLQFSRGARLRSQSGALLFGSSNGFYYFDPSSITPNPFAPRVALTSLRLFGERKPEVTAASTDVRLRYSENVFTIEFAALDFTFPRRNSYAYQLEGFDDRWITLGPKRDVTFTNLNPGVYVFRARASNSDGVWSDLGASLAIEVTPRPGLAAWWRVLALALLAAVLAGLHAARVHRLARRQREIEQRLDGDLSKARNLRGLLRWCPSCRTPRQGAAYWSQVEACLRTSPADVEKSLCPACFARLHPDEVGHAR